MDFISDQAKLFIDVVTRRQDDICSAFSDIEPVDFKVDLWDRPGGGGGNTRTLTSPIFEKAGVNTSQVFGAISNSEQPLFNQLIKKVDPTFSLTEHSLFFATGISLVIHPKNPFIPTVHANYRYFECHNDDHYIWWMGGGADLTPYYLFDDDVIHFHKTHQKICNQYQAGVYDHYKLACDDYFFLKHRGETRGVGGIFFDYLHDDFPAQFEFIVNISKGFIEAYFPIVEKRKGMPFSEEHRQWQAIRRGRYAEFNLLYDRGTLFGLKTNGRIESILMSMPPLAQWVYNHQPLKNSPEDQLLSVLKSPKNWVSSND